MKTSKRIIAILLCLVLTLSCLPGTIFAANTASGDGDAVKPEVVEKLSTDGVDNVVELEGGEWTLTGQEPEDSRWITVPYCVGVALGVAVFYALPSARAITPMEVKLSAYRADMEKAEGREIHDGP